MIFQTAHRTLTMYFYSYTFTVRLHSEKIFNSLLESWDYFSFCSFFYTIYCHNKYLISRWWHLVFLFDLMNSSILPRLQSNLSLIQVWKIPGVESSRKKRGGGMCDSWLHSLLCQNSTYLPPTLVRNNLGNKFIYTHGYNSEFRAHAFFVQCILFLPHCSFLGNVQEKQQ